ncbi:hypothetical protein [Nitrospirillum iridis]|uniref:Uncharacterized protein n=1 Tax=Nitrospirillum iridis TaxID=765888 RepID=A0A7X0EEP6_9PROT|nr:hypothetical protein [Nitrospirillum iridis]MBB6253245.1 hypothetical protein [Nitrospirillum iridis]
MMTTYTRSITAWRRPSPGYLLHLALAAVAITFLAIGLDGALKIRAQADPMEAMDGVGLVGFLFSWLLVFGFRLIFWARVPAQSQNLIRGLLTLVLCAEVIAAVIALLLAMTQPDGDPVGGQGREIMVIFSTAFGGLCQIGTAIWPVRCRRK